MICGRDESLVIQAMVVVLTTEALGIFLVGDCGCGVVEMEGMVVVLMVGLNCWWCRW